MLEGTDELVSLNAEAERKFQDYTEAMRSANKRNGKMTQALTPLTILCFGSVMFTPYLAAPVYLTYVLLAYFAYFKPAKNRAMKLEKEYSKAEDAFRSRQTELLSKLAFGDLMSLPGGKN